MNVLDKYKAWTEDLIREDLKKRAFNFAVLMENFVGDFNIGSVLRSCNAFGGKEMYYYGNKCMVKIAETFFAMARTSKKKITNFFVKLQFF